jgi:hypothetical protein
MAKSYHHGNLKSEIIKKAAEIIQKKGQTDFTLREIAQSLKVSHAAVYRHFKSKQDLLSHLAEEGFYVLTAKMISEIPKGRSIRQKMNLAGRAYIEFAINNVGHYRSMFHPDLHCNGPRRPELNAAGEKAFATLLEIIMDGIESKIFVKKDPRQVANFAWSSIHGFSILLLDGQLESLQSDSAVQSGIIQHLDMIERSLLK